MANDQEREVANDQKVEVAKDKEEGGIINVKNVLIVIKLIKSNQLTLRVTCL